MKGLAISGGSTKIGFLAGAAIELMKNNDYEILVGISAGSIICLLLGVKDYDTLEYSILDTTEDDFFEVKPTKKNGKISFKALMRVISGKQSLGKYSLDKLLKKYYTPEKHDLLRQSGKIVKIGAVNLNLVKIEYCDITKVDYETAIQWVVASSSIPITTETVKIGEYYYIDGGALEHVGGMNAIEEGVTSLDVVFSRPERLELTESDVEWKPYNVLGVILRTLSVMSRNITLENESEIKLTCYQKNIPLNMYFTPFMLTSSLYKMDKDLSKSWFELGKQMILNPDTDNEYHNNLEEE
jgi:predicted acylesterase/phospholipase RssA